MTGFSDKYGVQIPFSALDAYNDTKERINDHLNDADVSLNLSNMEGLNYKGIVIEQPEGYPNIEFIGK